MYIFFFQANRIVTNLLNINPSTDKHLENEVIKQFYHDSKRIARLCYNTYNVNKAIGIVEWTSLNVSRSNTRHKNCGFTTTILVLVAF